MALKSAAFYQVNPQIIPKTVNGAVSYRNLTAHGDLLAWRPSEVKDWVIFANSYYWSNLILRPLVKISMKYVVCDLMLTFQVPVVPDTVNPLCKHPLNTWSSPVFTEQFHYQDRFQKVFTAVK